MNDYGPPGQSRVIRIPSLRRGKVDEPMSNRVKLERVLGLTVSTNAGLDCSPGNDQIAYPAGCTVVLFDPVKNRQSHLVNSSRKTITCLRFSPDGRLLATGENGHMPSVRVWDLADGAQLAEFAGHKYGVSCVTFSPSQKYLVSVGCEHDMIVNVWDWKSRIKVASNKVSNKVKAVAFSDNGKYFVTAGNRLVKFWYLEYSKSDKVAATVPLMGRSAILGEQCNNDFCDVACGRGEMADSTFAITRSGLLCEFNHRRMLDKWVELKTSCANCMTVTESWIFIGCAEGIVRCFSPLTLEFVTTLPRPHYLGVDIAQVTDISHTTTKKPGDAKYPDTMAVSYSEKTMKLTCIYNDHSLYIWDVKDIKGVGKMHSFLYHSACIWGVEMYPDGGTAMPAGSFLTCSSDDTVRVWNLDQPDPRTHPGYRTNIYSKELLKIMYMDPDLSFLKDLDLTKGEKGDCASYDGRNGVRSVRVSPDGSHLASGDREGNIRITDMHSLAELVRIEAHDGEVLCVEYGGVESRSNGRRFLASASRDRLIHVFSVDDGYNLVQTLDDHSSSITSVRFLNYNNQLQMVSCGADKSIIFRTLEQKSSTDYQPTFVRAQITATKTTLYDMEADCLQKHVLTACQDRNIRVYSVSTGKHTKTFKGAAGDDGSLIKVTMDPSGILAATSSTDKTLSIYDYYSSECVATMLGHSELATGLRFTRDCRRLISASGDGCIFVWKMPHDLVVTMRSRLAQQAARAGKKLTQLGITHGDNEENDIVAEENSINSDPEYRLSMVQLPQWAQKSILDVSTPAVDGGRAIRGVAEPPKGRWAVPRPLDPSSDRHFYSASIGKDKRLDSDGSKEDSSIDSGTELFKQDTRRRFGQMGDVKEQLEGSGQRSRSRHHTDDSSLGSFKYEEVESTEHDGDVEDMSEGEGEEGGSSWVGEGARPLYYPAHEDTNSDYTVNAMDVEELRRSVRRTGNRRPDLLPDAAQSVSGSQSDDDASTPSGELSDRKLTGSSESLNLLSRREKVLKNTYESLSGAEMEKEPSPKSKSTLSSRHVSSAGATLRNSQVIEAARHTRHDAQASGRREELQRRIEETRRQLQCVGYRSNLESSQSIQDLSPRGMSYHDNRKVQPQKNNFQVPKIVVQADLSGGIRRSCSLSDLANFPNKQRTHSTSTSVAPGKSLNVKSSRSGVSRHATSKTAAVSAIRRSTSVGTLNQSDSESEQSRGGGVRRVMRPTISSLNKTISGQKGSASNRRRPISNSYSTMALNKPNLEDSSSEDGKNNRVSQTRSSSTERAGGGSGRRLGRSGSERDLSHSRVPSRTSKTQRSATSAMVRSTSNLEDSSTNASLSLDFENTPMPELLNYVREEMTLVGRHMAQVRRRLAAESGGGDWTHTFHQTISEHIKSIRRFDPDDTH